MVKWNYCEGEGIFKLTETVDVETVISNRIIRMIGVERLLLVIVNVKIEVTCAVTPNNASGLEIEIIPRRPQTKNYFWIFS
jgi:hypothetical protein